MKQEAKILISKFYNIDNMTFGMAKECASIAIREAMSLMAANDKLKDLERIYWDIVNIDFYDYYEL